VRCVRCACACAARGRTRLRVVGDFSRGGGAVPLRARLGALEATALAATGDPLIVTPRFRGEESDTVRQRSVTQHDTHTRHTTHDTRHDTRTRHTTHDTWGRGGCTLVGIAFHAKDRVVLISLLVLHRLLHPTPHVSSCACRVVRAVCASRVCRVVSLWLP
jgi:hypothetical protein